LAACDVDHLTLCHPNASSSPRAIFDTHSSEP
jgi:hypothetical protein